MDEELAKVRAFHDKFKLPAAAGFPCRARLRFDLINEELAELWTAIEEGSEVKALDALADIMYTTLGTAVEWGLPLAEAFDEVHRSKMTKEGGGYRADGKVLKGPGYTPPNIAGILAKEKAPAAKKEPEPVSCAGRLLPYEGSLGCYG